MAEDSKVGKKPDAKWNGIYWEYKNPSSTSAVDTRLRVARNQIMEALKRENKECIECGIVLDISNRKIPIDEMIKCIEDKSSDRCSNNTIIIIKDLDAVVKVLKIVKYKK